MEMKVKNSLLCMWSPRRKDDVLFTCCLQFSWNSKAFLKRSAWNANNRWVILGDLGWCNSSHPKRTVLLGHHLILVAVFTKVRGKTKPHLQSFCSVVDMGQATAEQPSGNSPLPAILLFPRTIQHKSLAVASHYPPLCLLSLNRFGKLSTVLWQLGEQTSPEHFLCKDSACIVQRSLETRSFQNTAIW